MLQRCRIPGSDWTRSTTPFFNPCFKKQKLAWQSIYIEFMLLNHGHHLMGWFTLLTASLSVIAQALPQSQKAGVDVNENETVQRILMKKHINMRYYSHIRVRPRSPALQLG